MAELMAMQRADLDEAGWHHRVRQQIIEDLLSGQLTWESWRQRRQLAGCRVETPLHLFVVDGGRQRPGSRFRDNPREPYRWLDADEGATVISADTRGLLWVLASGSAGIAMRQRLTVLCRADRTVGFLDAGTAEDFDALRTLTTRARYALYHRRPLGEVQLSGLKLPVLLARLDPDTRQADTARVLGPLSDDLRHTLRVYFDHDRGVSDAAAALNVHRNTLAYRLSRVTDLTDRDPRAFQDAVVLQVALYLRELSGSD
ncbi:PucR family transcriptional regulator [Streptomyces oceani]